MNRLIFLSVIAFMMQPQAGLAQGQSEMPVASSSARDLYIGCSLYLRGTDTSDTKDNVPYSASRCAATAFTAFGYSQKIKPGNEWEYCVPENAASAADPLRFLVTTFVESYESYRFPDLNKQGLTMMLYMFKANLPCTKSK